jgi:glycerate kinase
MNILIAPDSFKDCMSAKEVALALGRGIRTFLPHAGLFMHPMADGGEGTVESVIDATGGKRIELRVLDPLLREISSFYGITGDGTSAVIEMAAASGLELLAPEERDPWVTSTFGTGQLIKDAMDRGCRRILLGIGGSATNDGGAGMAEALGVEFTGRFGKLPARGGGSLGEVLRIRMEGLDQRIARTSFLVACDVNNPLTGPGGASAIYGPQKGADQAMVEKLDRNLAYFAGIIEDQLGKNISELPGAGAAGGLGAGMVAFLDATLMPGVPMIAEATGLEEKIQQADLVITGEGKMDAQTRFGKTPYGVAQLAKKHNKPVIGVAGTLEEDAGLLYQEGFDLLISIQEKPMELAESLADAGSLLERTGVRIARMIGLWI